MRARGGRFSSRRRGGDRHTGSGLYVMRRIGFKRQGRLQIGARAAAPASAIILNSAGNFPAPFRLDGQVSFRRMGCGMGNSARNRGAAKNAEGSVTETTNVDRIAVHGAAMLTGFYHRSVLRCGCLAERKSGVVNIVAARGNNENIYRDLSRIEYPGQPETRKLQSIDRADWLEFQPARPRLEFAVCGYPRLSQKAGARNHPCVLG